MHRCYLITIIAFAGIVCSQASNVSESDPAASATSPVSTDSTDSGESIPKVKRPLRLSTTIPTISVRGLLASSPNTITETLNICSSDDHSSNGLHASKRLLRERIYDLVRCYIISNRDGWNSKYGSCLWHTSTLGHDRHVDK